ncbi:MAG: hypothetical protein AAF605_02975 [Myxococcota bacterium]
MMIAFVLVVGCWLVAAPDAIEGPPRFSQVVILQLEASFNAGRFDDVDKLLDRLESRDADAMLMARYRGLVAVAREDFETAAVQLGAAIELGDQAPVVSLYLAHAQMRLGRANDALVRLENVGSSLESGLSAALIRARAYRAIGRSTEAYETLRDASSRFEDSMLLVIELIVLCVELELLGESVRWIEVAASRENVEPEDALAIIELSYRNPNALEALEQLALRFRGDPDIQGHLAYGYAEAGHAYLDARLFSTATLLGGDYAFEAADQYRLVRDYNAALRFNGWVPSERRRLRQRIAILFEAEQWSRVVALEPGWQRLRNPDDVLRYQTAYAYYRLGRPVRATEVARSVKDGPWEESASLLVQAMDRARSNDFIRD